MTYLHMWYVPTSYIHSHIRNKSRICNVWEWVATEFSSLELEWWRQSEFLEVHQTRLLLLSNQNYCYYLVPTSFFEKIGVFPWFSFIQTSTCSQVEKNVKKPSNNKTSAVWKLQDYYFFRIRLVLLLLFFKVVFFRLLSIRKFGEIV